VLFRLALTDDQLAMVMVAAGGLPVEKRGLFLEQVAARLMLRDRFNDADLDDAVRVALRRLIESAA
jgi:hypothetical protein